MNKAISLSLLLLIAGNGLIVTQAHAGFGDMIKNISQYGLSPEKQKQLGTFCVGTGVFCLFAASIGMLIFLDEARSLSTHTSIVGKADAAHKEPFQTYIDIDKHNIKHSRTCILLALGSGIPLTALGAYLIKKA